MEKSLSVIGGDLRNAKLIEGLAKDNFNVATFGLEKADELKNLKNVTICKTLQEAVINNKVIISAIPFSSNNTEINAPFSEEKITIESIANNISNKLLIAGSIKSETLELLKTKKVKTIDFLDREELAVLNAIPTAEGAIQIAMENTSKTLHGSNVLILGFGRIAKILAKMLNGIGAKVTCAARKNSDISWIKSYGYEAILFEDIDNYLSKFEIIMNTVPQIVLNEQRLQKLSKTCLIIDLASKPGGVDNEAAEKLSIKSILALALPGKVAPTTSANYMKETIYNILKEEF